MAITFSGKTFIVDATDSATAIVNAINSEATYTTFYAAGIMPISNNKWKILILYA